MAKGNLRREGEVGLGRDSALGIGTYCFACVVNEISMHPRPASHSHADNVETDHPHAQPVWLGRCRALLNCPDADLAAAGELLIIQQQ